ncbi:WD40-like Beta Propeller Repeat [Marivirga sericea]|uniref:WD40-like Beta Propeller Repeat n=1 Tax=Marivirga sericea TaxID=1028 RepID=A0A1X7L8Z5_9BACT|nr:OmpA family protein [Marivirga sericea]SMG50306.1 WD40-like Beta Propeller Repeat [Marivirga sericea]
MIYKFRFFLVFLLSVAFAFNLKAQEPNPELAKEFLFTAEEILKETKALNQAVEMYKLAAETDPNSVEANYKTGDTYLQITDKAKATQYLLRAYQLDSDYKFDMLYKIGSAYQYGYEFDKAIDYYKQYKQKLESNTGYKGADRTPMYEVDRRIEESNTGKRLVADPVNYSITSVGTAINSESWDFAPVVNADETVMIFTSRRGPDQGNLNENVFDDNFYYEDIFISKKSGGEWQTAENIGPVVNTRFHDSNFGFAPDGKTLYIYSDEGNGDIYFTNNLSEDTWSEPIALSDNINSSGYNEKSVSQSADGNTLFFSSNRPGGNGGFDIYFSKKNRKDEWGPSQNLGRVINTEGDEDGSFIQYDGKTLYFSSTGHSGMGGYDIFKSEYDSTSQEWSNPENLGYPLNSPDDDIYLVMSKDGKTGYYSTVREEGMGYTDIYKVKIGGSEDDTDKKVANKKATVDEGEDKTEKEEVAKVEVPESKEDEMTTGAPVKLMVRVVDAKTNQNIDASVKLKGQKDNINVPAESNENGIYTFVIVRDEATNFMLAAEKSGYIFANKRITLPASTGEEQTIRQTLSLDRPEVGTSKTLRNIFFEFGKATFTSASYEELNKMVSFMEANPQVNVEIAGHTDNIGSASVNKKLSQLRANKVVNYLTEKGIDRRRLNAVGYGEERPIVSNDDEVMGREINRRVEFIVKE